MRKGLISVLALVLVAGVALPVSAVPVTAQAANDAQVTDLIAGRHMTVGTVSIWDDCQNLYVEYNVTEAGWGLEETHLAVASFLWNIPQKNGNPIPGRFPYSHENLGGVTSDMYTIPLSDINKVFGNNVFIATHAGVMKANKACIDFEQYAEKDEVSIIATENGDVSFYMVSSDPLVGLTVGESADLTPVPGAFPAVAAPDTSPPYDNIVAFTVNDPPNTYRDDYIRDAAGTGAGGMTITDPQDLTQTDLLKHAYSQYLAIVVDVSDISNIQGLDLVSIDLDHTEMWYFQYFNEDDELLQEITLGPGTGTSGDGAAFAVEYSDPELSKVAIWGGMNLGERERIGYAIDNVCVTSVQDETAWAGCCLFPGRNWAMFIVYHVQCPTGNGGSLGSRWGFFKNFGKLPKWYR